MYLPNTNLELVNRLTSFPEGYKNVLFATETSKSLEEIAKKLDLSESETDAAAKLIYDVFSGGLPLDEFDKSLQDVLNFDDLKIAEVLDLLTTDFINPLMERLEQAHAIPSLVDLQDLILGDNADNAVASEQLNPEEGISFQKDIVISKVEDPQRKSIRSPASVSYTNAKPSHERTGKEGILGDPYREQEL